MNKLTVALLCLVLAAMSVPAGASKSQTYGHGQKAANRAQKQQNKQLKRLMKQQARARKKQDKEAAKSAKMWNKRAQHGVLKRSTR